MATKIQVPSPEKRLSEAQVVLTNLFARGKTQKYISDVLGVPQSDISKIYSGKRTCGKSYNTILFYDKLHDLITEVSESHEGYVDSVGDKFYQDERTNVVLAGLLVFIITFTLSFLLLKLFGVI